MIAFATLLLGLIVGPQPVEILVDASVASVELLLDGSHVATLEPDNWSTSCDFGPKLEPHELIAVAYDAKGREVGRVRQWINMPRRPAEASVALEGGHDGTGVVAHLAWESVVDAEPISVTATFDGNALPVTNPRRIELPSFNTAQLHHFRAEIDFSSNVSSVVEATFAGTYVDRVNTELTAVPMLLDKRAQLPTLAGLTGRFTKDSNPLTVVAVEEGPAEVVVVRDEGARRDLIRLHRRDQEALWRRARGGTISDRQSARTRMSLPENLKLRFLWPVSDRQQRSGYALEIFPPSEAFTSRDGGLFWLLTYARQPASARDSNRFADAVAASALLASERNRRRAVVLVIGSDGALNDQSQFEVAPVRRFLGHLGVPLTVWLTNTRARISPAWGPSTDISSLKKLERAGTALFSTLERQRIVWLEGTHLPQDIELEADRLNLRLIR